MDQNRLRHGRCEYDAKNGRWLCGEYMGELGPLGHMTPARFDPDDGTRLNNNGTTTPMVPAACDDADFRWAVAAEELAERMETLNRTNANCEWETECKLAGITLTALQTMKYWISTARTLEQRMKLGLPAPGCPAPKTVPRKALDTACHRILKLTEWRGCPTGKAADCDNARHRTDKFRCIKCMGDAVLEAVAAKGAASR